MMCEILEFGRYFLVVDNLLLAEVVDEDRVDLISTLASPYPIRGDDARKFVTLARARARRCMPTAPPADAASPAPAEAPPEPPEDGTREAPGGGPSIVSGVPLHAPRPTAGGLRPPVQGQG